MTAGRAIEGGASEIGGSFEELADGEDVDGCVGAEAQKVAVAADNAIRVSGDGALDDAIIIGVLWDHAQDLPRLDYFGSSLQAGADKRGIQLRNGEFEAQFFVEFVKQRRRGNERKGAEECEIEKRSRESAEHEGGDIDVGIGNDAHQECFSCLNSSESRSTSASERIPRAC